MIADDTALPADTNQNLQHLMDAARKRREDMGLRMNVNKTKTMVIPKEENHSANILLNSESLDQIH